MAGSISSMGVCPAFLFRRRVIAGLALIALFGLTVTAPGQRRHGPSPLDTLGGEVSQEEGWRILEQFRSLGLAGDYRFRFQMRILPRRGKASDVNGTLLGTMSERGPVSRLDIVLEEASIGERGELIPARTRRLLLQNGLFSEAYELVGEGAEAEARPIPADRQFETIAGSELAIFDLLMPFIYWQRFVYEGRTTFRGRPTHVFWLYPQEEDTLAREQVSGVRIFLDEEFFALIQAEIYDASEALAKTLTIVDFKKVEGHWILNQVEARNEKTRDKTRFRVTDASMDLDLPSAVFHPDGLRFPVHGSELDDFEARSD